jgi:serine/threonine protein kinase
VLRENNSSITYIGWDLSRSLKIAIEEYIPLRYIARDASISDAVCFSNNEMADSYMQLASKYDVEMRRLSMHSGLPGIVSVKDVFHENLVVYTVMEFIQGISFHSYMWLTMVLQKWRFKETWVLDIMKTIIESLNQLHKDGIVHHAISLDNIISYSMKGDATLCGFGAAVYAENDIEELFEIMKRGCLAPEQLCVNEMQPGPWTDVYAICGVIYRLIERKVPHNFRLIFNDDPLCFNEPVSENTRSVISKGLSYNTKDRWQNAGELAEALYG